MGVFMSNNFGSFANLGDFGEGLESGFNMLTKSMSDVFGIPAKGKENVPSYSVEHTDTVDTWYFDMPGCKKESVDVCEEDGYLVIRATRSVGGTTKFATKFKPKFGTDAIECSYADGVLTIINKKVEKEPTDKKFKVL